MNAGEAVFTSSAVIAPHDGQHAFPGEDHP